MKKECGNTDGCDNKLGTHLPEGRRDFLNKCGRFAAYVVPATVILLSHRESAAVTIGSQPLQ